MLKQISFAALAATFIGGSAALAHAESSISNEDFNTSGGMQSDMRTKQAASAAGMSYTNAYGYAPASRPARSHGAAPKQNTTPKHKH
jgi:hypothetical protein